jgi:hypothetical protein
MLRSDPLVRLLGERSAGAVLGVAPAAWAGLVFSARRSEAALGPASRPNFGNLLFASLEEDAYCAEA